MKQRYAIEIEWGWASFNEVERDTVDDPDEVDERIEKLIPRIVERYAFDCNRLEMPMHPRIYGVRITPIGESEYRWVFEAVHPKIEAAVEKKRQALIEAEDKRKAEHGETNRRLAEQRREREATRGF